MTSEPCQYDMTHLYDLWKEQMQKYYADPTAENLDKARILKRQLAEQAMLYQVVMRKSAISTIELYKDSKMTHNLEDLEKDVSTELTKEEMEMIKYYSDIKKSPRICKSAEEVYNLVLSGDLSVVDAKNLLTLEHISRSDEIIRRLEALQAS